MATGIGKGNIIHRLCEKQMRSKPDSKILIIAGTKVTFVSQTHEALAGYQAQNDRYISAEDDKDLVEETTAPGYNPLTEQRSLLYKTGNYGQAGVDVEIATVQK
jgi:type I site-specific restriction endonuclease